MGEVIAGYELPERKSITDLESWAPFVGWFKAEYGCDPVADAHQDRELFEAWLSGAHWEWGRGRSVPFVTEGKV